MRCLIIVTTLVLAFPTLSMEFEGRFSYSGLSYVLGIPDSVNKDTPVLLLLHGCKMDGKTMLKLTEIEKYADEKKIVVVAPSQSVFKNFDRCWNFYSTENQRRGVAGSESAQLLRIVKLVQTELGLRHDNTYVMGISSGGAQAMNLFACYPDVFKGAGIHSGVAFRAAQGLAEASEVIKLGPAASSQTLRSYFHQCAKRVKSRLRSVAVIHGLKDQRVVPSNGRALQAQLDGVKTLRLMYLEIESLAHKWSGSQATSPYADPNGPVATKIFLDHLGL